MYSSEVGSVWNRGRFRRRLATRGGRKTRGNVVSSHIPFGMVEYFVSRAGSHGAVFAHSHSQGVCTPCRLSLQRNVMCHRSSLIGPFMSHTTNCYRYICNSDHSKIKSYLLHFQNSRRGEGVVRGACRNDRDWPGRGVASNILCSSRSFWNAHRWTQGFYST